MKSLRALVVLMILSASPTFAGGGGEDVYAVRINALLAMAKSQTTYPIFRMITKHPLQAISVINAYHQSALYFKILGDLTDEELATLRGVGICIEAGTLFKIKAKSNYANFRNLLDPFYSFYFGSNMQALGVPQPPSIKADIPPGYKNILELVSLTELKSPEELPFAGRPVLFNPLVQDGHSALVVPVDYFDLLGKIHPSLFENQSRVLVISDWVLEPTLAYACMNLGAFLAERLPHAQVISTSISKPCEDLNKQFAALPNYSCQLIDNEGPMNALASGSFDLILASKCLCVCASSREGPTRTCAGIKATREDVTKWIHKIASKLKRSESSMAILGAKCGKMVDVPWPTIAKQFAKIGIMMQLIHAPEDIGGYLSMIVLKRPPQ